METIMRDLLVGASALLPDFNDKLLLQFRDNKLKSIKRYLNDLFIESVKLFDGELRYVGYAELTPDERIEYIKNNTILKHKIDIQKSTFELVRYTFEFSGAQYHLHVHVPFLDHGAVWLKDTKYYPMLPIVERGGLHRTHRDVIIKVMRAPLTFKRAEQYTFGTDKGHQYRETVVTVKIHQRRRGRGAKRTDRTPLLLYHLSKNSFQNVMQMYGMSSDVITLVNKHESHDDFAYVKIKDDIFLRVAVAALDNRMNRRVIASYLMCLEEYPRFDMRELLAPHSVYYTTVLGKYTYPAATNAALLFDHACEHLKTTDTLLDPPAQRQLAQIGIVVHDIYDLLLYAFFNMDNWVVGYNPTDLYTKKIGSLDQIMASVVSTINSKLFQIINTKNKHLSHDVIKSFVTGASQHENWLAGNPTFRASPTMCNGNWLCTIGTKRFRSLENTETKASKGKTSKNMPLYLLKAHPSHLVVESINALPPSSPIVSGEINPFLIIDDDGNIIKPDWADALDHIFD